VVHRPPRAAGVDRARWTLAALRTAVAWLGRLTDAGASRLLRRLGVRYRRGQAHLHSPDPAYRAKMAAVVDARIAAVDRPGAVVFLYQDEFTACRRPSVARAWHEAGGPGRPAELGQAANTERRLIGALDAVTGRLTCWPRAHADVDTLIGFYRAVAAAYPDAGVIYVAQDNWPVHFHERVLAAVGPLRVRLLRLPTYAPWTNPIEKVWRRLKQELLHQHDFGDDWAALKAALARWLGRWSEGSLDLLHYVGLYPD
jgi:transposase